MARIFNMRESRTFDLEESIVPAFLVADPHNPVRVLTSPTHTAALAMWQQGAAYYLADRLSDTNQTAIYGNNVILSGDSFLDANRASATTTVNTNTIVLGNLTVQPGSHVLNVDSGNMQLVLVVDTLLSKCVR